MQFPGCNKHLKKFIKFLGDDGEREPPVPIPNTAVKPLSVDGTCRATRSAADGAVSECPRMDINERGRESRTFQELIFKPLTG